MLKNKFSRLIKFWPVLIIPAYIYGWSILTDQSTTYSAFDSKLTVNIVIVFFIVGTMVEKFTRNMPKWKGWGVWAACTLIMILFFKYVGGLDTWW